MTRTDVVAGTFVLGFLIDEGKRLPLAEVRFEGNKNFSSGELAAKDQERSSLTTTT